jgi:uncharacterized DUF497 family protein
MTNFEWDDRKNASNLAKHGVSFYSAQFAFSDLKRVIMRDDKHSTRDEVRYFCLGKVDNQVMTVRFTYRAGKIRIIGAGYWRAGEKIYDK